MTRKILVLFIIVTMTAIFLPAKSFTLDDTVPCSIEEMNAKTNAFPNNLSDSKLTCDERTSRLRDFPFGTDNAVKNFKTSFSGKFAGGSSSKAELVIGVNYEFPNSYSVLEKTINERGGRIVKNVSSTDRIFAIEAEIPYENLPNLISEIQSSNYVRYVEPKIRYQALYVPNDPYWIWQWGPKKIEADYAWNTTFGDPSILVAVIDTGIDYDHPDLANNYVPLGYDWVNDDPYPMDDHGHGTHCAGIIAAEIDNNEGIAGLAQVKIMAEKAIDEYGWGLDTDLANAIIHAVDQGADILSNSWGGLFPSEVIHDAIEYAYENNVLVVAAAGNGGTKQKVYPAAYDEVIAVTATDSNDDPAWFTSFGDWVEVAAPGVDIYSTVWDDSYTYMSGTSMACPHASGTAALIWSRFPNATRDWVRAQLRYTSDDLGEVGFDEYYGYGRINARKAVEQLPPSHDLLIFDLDKPSYIKVGESATFNITVLNFGTNSETDVEVQLLVNGSVVDSTVIPSLSWGASVTTQFSWTPAIEGTYNITSYIVPVPDETNTQNNILEEIVTVVAPPPETNWILLATDPDEGIGTNLKAIYGQYYSGVIFFKVEHYRSWTTISEIDTGIFIDADQDPSTGLPDGTYPGQYTGIGADYVIVVGYEGTQMWRWDPIDQWWDLDNPIPLAYLDAPENSNVFVVGIYPADIEMAQTIDCAVTDVPSDWDWMPDTEHFTWTIIRYEHDLAVSLEAPEFLEPGETSMLNATVYNAGLSNETDVQIQLLINGEIVENETIPLLVNGTSYTIQHLWTPTMEGIYNVTAYAPPLPGENVTANNLMSIFVSVQTFPDILIVNDDDGGNWIYGTSLSEFESALATVGYDYWIWNESSMGNPSLDFLSRFELVIWTCGDYWNWAVDPIDAETLEAYLVMGGNILLEGEDIGYDHDADNFMVNVAHAIMQVDGTGAPGLTVTDPTHPVTSGLPANFNWLIDPPYDDGVLPTNGGIEIIQYTGTAWTAVTVFKGTSSGSVVYYAFPLYCLPEPYRTTLAVNSVNWLLGIKYEHDLAVKLDAPDFLEPGESVLLNVTVYNEGLSNETDVQIQLLINGEIVENETIPLLVNGTSYTIQHLWTPTMEGIYNITAYAPPVPSENITTNNVVSVTTIVKYIIARVAVLNAVEIPSYFTGGWSNDYQTLVDALIANGFYAQAVTNEEIIEGILVNFDVFVMVDNVPNDAAVPYVYDFWLNGGGIVAFDSSICFLCYAGILPPESAGSNGYYVYWDYNTGSTAKISTAHPVTAGYTVGQLISGQSGDAEYLVSALADTVAYPYYTKLAEDISISDHAYISAYEPPNGGKVVHIWDQWHWDNTDLQLIILNAMNWTSSEYEHELVVSLETPTVIEPGDLSLLNATVYNRGLSNETDVELQLLINGSIVDSVVIPELLVNSSYTISYSWTPSIEGVYNITAYVTPVENETFIENNVATRFVHVRKIKGYILFDQTHGTMPIDSYTIWLDHLEYLGFIIETHDYGPITEDLLEEYDVFVTIQAYTPYSSSELEAIQNFVLNGGGLLVIGDDNPYIYTELTSFADITWGSGGCSGITYDITPHEVTEGVDSVYLESPFSVLYVSGDALSLVRDPCGNTMLAVAEVGGKVAGFADENSFTDYSIMSEDNLVLAENLIAWLALASPVPVVTYEPLDPYVGEVITFDASKSYDPDGTIVSYKWDFGDGSTANGSVVTHTYKNSGTFTVTLTLTDDDGQVSTVTLDVKVSRTTLNVEVEVGSIHFRNELTQFYILVTQFGQPTDANITACLYYNGSVLADLSSAVSHVETGVYLINYKIPSDAPAGTYMLLVKADRYGVKGSSIATFLISSTLTGWNAKIIEISDNIATVVIPDLGTIKLQLDDINATIAEIHGKTVTIETILGTIKGNITSISGDIFEIKTDVGFIRTTLEGWTGQIALAPTDKGTFKILLLTTSTIEGEAEFSDDMIQIVVSGTPGTSGTLVAVIPEQLLADLNSDPSKIKVLIDDSPVSFTMQKHGDSYTIRVNYTHSTHVIKIFLAEKPLPAPTQLQIVILMVALLAILLTTYLYIRRKKKAKENQ